MIFLIQAIPFHINSKCFVVSSEGCAIVANIAGDSGSDVEKGRNLNNYSMISYTNTNLCLKLEQHLLNERQ